MKINEQWECWTLIVCVIKMKARTAGENGRHLWTRLVQKIAECENVVRVELENNSDDLKRRKKPCTHHGRKVFFVCRRKTASAASVSRPVLWALRAKLINCRSQVRPCACGGRLGPSDSQLRFYPVGFCNIGLLCFLTSMHYCYFSDSIVSFAM